MPPAESVEPRREALIVAADAYEDPKLRALRAPARDAEELARVLGDPEIGDFSVGVSLNEPDHVVRRKLSEFFRDRGRDDLLLLHISCHGLKDEDGTLYFASSNTTVEHLEATAIPSEFVNRQMTKSRSRRIVLLLDCCFGGAFAKGMVHRAGESVAIKEEFDGQGRVILTASRATEYAFEGDNVEGDARPSIFTSAIVQGLESGLADRDGDSRVSVDELYDYVYDRVRDATPNQTPSKWTFDVQGDLYVARSPFRAEPEPAELPIELLAAMESPFANVRAGAVEELAGLLAGTHAGLASAARLALEQLAEDDSKRVSEAASSALGDGAPEPVPIVLPEAEPLPRTVPPRPPQRRRSSASSRLAVAAARAAGWKDGLALGGAAALVLGYFVAANWTSLWSHTTEFNEEAWLIWSPLEASGSVLLAVWAVLATRAGRFRREAADGLLMGVGLLAAAATVGLVYHEKNASELGAAPAVTALGAAALIGAGALGLLTRRAAEGGLPRGASVLAVPGIALCLAPLVVTFGAWEKTTLLDYPERGLAIELLVASGLGGLAALALIRVPRARLAAAGLLVAVGSLAALHVAAAVVFFLRWEGIDDARLAGPLGIAGGLLLAWTGLRVLRFRGRAEAPAAAGLPAM